MGKCNNAEHTERVNKVYELLINGWMRYDILQFVAKRTDWAISDSMVDNYIADAKVTIKENAAETREEFLEKAKNRFKDLYKKAMSEKQLGECRRLIETENKVLGYEKLNIDVKAEINIKDIDDKINELLKLREQDESTKQ